MRPCAGWEARLPGGLSDHHPGLSPLCRGQRQVGGQWRQPVLLTCCTHTTASPLGSCCSMGRRFASTHPQLRVHIACCPPHLPDHPAGRCRHWWRPYCWTHCSVCRPSCRPASRQPPPACDLALAAGATPLPALVSPGPSWAVGQTLAAPPAWAECSAGPPAPAWACSARGCWSAALRARARRT